jgi:tRNA U38,U39,U40 pseudouridine synthase TruA
LAQLLTHTDRTLAAPTFSASGLYLAAIHYDEAFGLPKANDALGACWGPTFKLSGIPDENPN